MNKLVNELAQKAEDYADDTYLPWLATYTEKLVELLIKECIVQIEIERKNPYRNMGDENRYGIGACDESIRRIKEHFGVKNEKSI